MLDHASKASSVESSVYRSPSVAIRLVILSAVALFAFIALPSCSADVTHNFSKTIVTTDLELDEFMTTLRCVAMSLQCYKSYRGDFAFRLLQIPKKSRFVGLTFPPTYWCSYWFGALCLFLGLSALSYLVLATVRLDRKWALQRLLRASEERENAAYEISDWLLQGLQAIVWSIETACLRAKGIEHVRELLTQSLRQSGTLMEEGRGRMMGLRRPRHGEHLPNAIAVAGNELRNHRRQKYTVIVHGEIRDLRPIVRDDVYKIGREALNNAFRHAGANQIEAEFFYEDSEMRVYVRDDGCGINSDALSGRIHGVHCGIRDMHRKARKAGAMLEIRSRRNAGTELELRIPASLAYQVDASAAKSHDTGPLIV